MNTAELISIARTDKDKIRNYFNRAAKRQSKWSEKFKKHELNALLLLCIETPVELCKFLWEGIHQMEEIINHPEYTHYKILKKKGGSREIFAPAKSLKLIQNIGIENGL